MEFEQEAQLLQRDHTTHFISQNLVKCSTAARKIRHERLAIGNGLEGDAFIEITCIQ